MCVVHVLPLSAKNPHFASNRRIFFWQNFCLVLRILKVCLRVKNILALGSRVAGMVRVSGKGQVICYVNLSDVGSARMRVRVWGCVCVCVLFVPRIHKCLCVLIAFSGFCSSRYQLKGIFSVISLHFNCKCSERVSD